MPLPNSLPWMESVDAKMIRAREHLEMFAQEVDEYLSTIRLNVYLKSSPTEPNPWLVVHASDYIPPVLLSAIAGDCIHNMRSALDNLVCGLALTLDPTCPCTGIAFPVLKDESDWNKKSDSYLKRIPAEAITIIRNLQPWSDTTTPNPLLILNNLSNIDKHRYCAFALAHSRNSMVRVYCLDGTAVDIWPRGTLFLGDVQTFAVPVPTNLLGRENRIKAKGTFVLNFRDEGPWGDLHVTDVLYRCFEHVETKVIARFQAAFHKHRALRI